jgi:hypothetical protein
VALERLQRRSCCSVPEPHCPIVRARDDLLAVRREGDGLDRVRVALERLERRTPMRLNSRLSFYPSRDTLLKYFSDNTLLWGEDKG